MAGRASSSAQAAPSSAPADAVAEKMRSVFDTTDLRDAIADRMASDPFRERVVDEWRGWGAKDVEARLAPCLADLKANFTTRPFAESLAFATFDWPASSTGLVDWLAAVLHAHGGAASRALPLPERARAPAVMAALLERFPRMRGNPQTDEMMETMILPFRAVVQAQAVAFAIDEAAKGFAGAAAATNAARSGGNSPAAPNLPPPPPPRPLTAAERHALSHLSGGEETLRRVETLREEADTAALLKLRAAAARRGQVTRYLDYALLFLQEDADEMSDADFVDKLRPLADAGLAMAQHDVGALLLKLAAAQHKLQRKRLLEAAGSEDGAVAAAAAGMPTELTSSLAAIREGADATVRSCDLATAIRWVQRSVSRGGATMGPLEVEAVNYLERASSLGHTEARVALGTWHVARASCLAGHGVTAAKELLAIRAPSKRSTPQGPSSPLPQGAASRDGTPPVQRTPAHSRRPSTGQPSPKNGSPSPTSSPAGSLGLGTATSPSSSEPPPSAWTVACKFHLRAALRVVEDVAEGLTQVWDRADHSEHVAAAKALMAEIAQLRQLLKMAAKRAAGGSELDVLNPWMREALGVGKAGGGAYGWLKAFRLFAIAAGLGAVYMCYVLWNAPPSQCRANYADSDRVAAAQRKRATSRAKQASRGDGTGMQ